MKPRYAYLSEKKRWFINYYITTEQGPKRVRENLMFIRDVPQRQEYARKRIALINEHLTRGVNPPPPEYQQQVSVMMAIKDMLDIKLSKKGIRQRTHITYRNTIEAFCRWLQLRKYDRLLVSQFTSAKAQEYMDFLITKKKVSGRTHNNHRDFLITFFNMLVKREQILHNPFKLISREKEMLKLRQGLTEAEQKKISEHIHQVDYPFWIICGLCFYCALRRTEITAIQKSDIDLLVHNIDMRAEIAKNKRDEHIAIPETFFLELAEWLKDVPPEYYICSRDFKPGPTRIHENRITERFNKYARELNIAKGKTFYGLKDTASMRMDEGGFAVVAQQQHLRHKDLSTTQKYKARHSPKIEQRIRTEFPKF